MYEKVKCHSLTFNLTKLLNSTVDLDYDTIDSPMLLPDNKERSAIHITKNIYYMYNHKITIHSRVYRYRDTAR